MVMVSMAMSAIFHYRQFPGSERINWIKWVEFHRRRKPDVLKHLAPKLLKINDIDYAEHFRYVLIRFN